MILGDVLDRNTVEQAILAMMLYLIMLAYQTSMSAIKPIDAINMNILGNALILEASINMKVKKYLFAILRMYIVHQVHL